MKSLGEIASLINGKLSGDANLTVNGVASLEDAKEGDLSFVLEQNKFLAAESSKASAFVSVNGFMSKTKPVICVDNPRLALSKVISAFAPLEEISPGIDPKAYISKDAFIGKRVLIYPFVYVGEGCVIGDDSIIHPNVTLYPGTLIGKRCIVHSGCVIGVDGFGFARDGGRFVKIPQIGNVVIEDDVELYANNSIARATLGSTVIKRGSKIDNMNHIAHNVVIGSDCAITAMSVFGGSSSIGDRVQMSGQCAIAPHAHVGSDSILMGRTVVTKNAAPGSVLLGFPAQDHVKENRMLALLRKLPDLFERVKSLESKKPAKSLGGE